MLVIALVFAVRDRQSNEPGSDSTLANSAADDMQQESAASIAVLPFVNMSSDPEQEYFSDGIAEELLNLLAKIPELRVPARTSSFQFKGQNVDIAKVAEQLNVAHVLEGSVRKAGVRVRITAQLIEAKTGYHLWSETYDKELTDIFAIQDEISLAIVTALSETLGLSTAAVPLVQAAANPEAYNAFLLGQHLIRKRTKQDIEAAIPNYVQTIELDRDLPEAGAVMGLVLQAGERYEESIPYFEKALRLNPSLTDVRNWYSSTLGALGRAAEAFRKQQIAYELDPLSILTLNNYASALVNRRQFDDLRPVLERLAQLDPARASTIRAGMLMSQQRAADAIIAVFRAVDMNKGNLRHRGFAAFRLKRLQPLEESADSAIDSGEETSSVRFGQAIFANLRGETEQAYEYLDQAMASELLMPANLARFYGWMGWNELPRFVTIKARHDEYRLAERRKFMVVACGPHGFVFWQPSPETCVEVVD